MFASLGAKAAVLAACVVVGLAGGAFSIGHFYWSPKVIRLSSDLATAVRAAVRWEATSHELEAQIARASAAGALSAEAQDAVRQATERARQELDDAQSRGESGLDGILDRMRAGNAPAPGAGGDAPGAAPRPR